MESLSLRLERDTHVTDILTHIHTQGPLHKGNGKVREMKDGPKRESSFRRDERSTGRDDLTQSPRPSQRAQRGGSRMRLGEFNLLTGQ